MEIKTKKKRNNTEHHIQSAIVEFLRLNKFEVIAVPNGTFFNAERLNAIIYAKYLKKEGVESGVSDLIVFKEFPHIYFCEIKSLTGELRDSQKSFKKKVEKLGFKYFVFRNLDDARILLQEVKKAA